MKNKKFGKKSLVVNGDFKEKNTKLLIHIDGNEPRYPSAKVTITEINTWYKHNGKFIHFAQLVEKGKVKTYINGEEVK